MNIGINGFGRIGRQTARIAITCPSIDSIHVNDLSDIETLSHLFKYDSIHGKFPIKFTLKGNELHFENGKKISFSNEKEPINIPWKKEGISTVIECTGIFLTYDGAKKHLDAGAKKVILSAPAKSDNIPSIVYGVNDFKLTGKELIISNASCTTNNAAALLFILDKLLTIESCYISTIHSYTSDQKIHDSPHRDLRRARAAAMSIVPTSTGAAKAIGKIIPSLSGKIQGGSFRVPIPNGSISEITLVCKENKSVEEINAAIKNASNSVLKNILGYTEEPLVSSDIIGLKDSCLFDSSLTRVIGKMIKVVGWYDNEVGYSCRLIDLTLKTHSK